MSAISSILKNTLRQIGNDVPNAYRDKMMQAFHESLKYHTETLKVSVQTSDEMIQNIADPKHLTEMEKHNAIRRAADELIKSGYYSRVQLRHLDGFRTDYIFSVLIDRGF